MATQKRNGKRLYFDYAASTPLDPRVERAMRPYFLKQFGNPGSLHSFGQEAIAAVDASRETLARLIGADFREVIFTGSATEANNLALRGAVWAWREQAAQSAKAQAPRAGVQPRMIVSAIEHESVLETARDLEHDGVEVIYLPVNRVGIVDCDALRRALNERTVVVSIMYANNEIGVIQPVAEIAALIADFKKSVGKNAIHPLFHTDAVQAFQFLDCDVRALGVDMMTLSAHKIYGPKGIGLLYTKNATTTKPFSIKSEITGGGQEFGLRSGTENVPLIVGFAKAAELTRAVREKEAKRVLVLRDHLFKGIKKIFLSAEINGANVSADSAENETMLPNILNVYIPGHTAEDMVVKLDLAGVAVSAGSACRARAMMSSYVIEALGYPKERAKSSLRFSLGRQTTKDDVVKLFGRLSGI
jgi:cysteine desulfurase